LKNHRKNKKVKKRKIFRIDLPFSVYVDIWKKVIEEEKTLKDYLLELAKENLTD